jgi:hypothetical protein
MDEKSRFVIGDVVIDKERNIGMVKSITPYPVVHGDGTKTTQYQITYGITNVWRRTIAEEELELYAPAERM